MRTPIQIRRRRRRLIAVALAAASLSTAPIAGARPDLDDPRNPLVTPPAPPAQEVEVVTADDFDWVDAGLGAGTAVGIVLLAGGAAAALTRRRRIPVAPKSLRRRHHEREANGMTTIYEGPAGRGRAG